MSCNTIKFHIIRNLFSCFHNALSVGVQNILQLQIEHTVISRCVFIMQCASHGILESLVIIYLKVDHSSFFAGYVGIIRINNTCEGCLAGCLRRIGHIGFGHNTECCYGILLDCGRIFGIRKPTHNIVTCTGHGKVTGAIHIEGTIPCKEVLTSVIHNEEGFSRNHHVKRIVRCLCCTLLGNCGFNRTGLGSKTDLTCIRTTDTGCCIGTGCCLCGLIHQVTECHGL